MSILTEQIVMKRHIADYFIMTEFIMMLQVINLTIMI